MRPLPSDLDFSELTAITIVHLVVFRGLRFAEIHRLNPTDFPSSPDGWKFWVVVKGHRKRELITIFPSQDPHLDTLSLLIELYNRIKSHFKEHDSPKSLWFKNVGSLQPLTYEEMRNAASSVLSDANIKEHRPYHIKHATLTFLAEQNVPNEEITAFARHTFGSTAAQAFYRSWDQGKGITGRIIESARTFGVDVCM
jgi:hypothetical protein